MKRREFDKIINSCVTNRLLDLSKIDALDNEVKTKLASFLITHRKPVLVNLVDQDHFVKDANHGMNWLHSMGYLYRSKGRIFSFYHTCEHEIV